MSSMVKHQPRSPLRYAGGKSRAVEEISKFIPPDTKIIYSPFFGGGSVELACAANGTTIYGYDNFRPVVEFWQCLLENPFKLAGMVRRHHPLERDEFYRLQKTYNDASKSKYERAAIFYALNRSSFSGTTVSGGMSPNHPRFTESSIKRLEGFDHTRLNGTVKVECMDFKQSIPLSNGHLLYMDPPYMINQKLYGDRGNMHDGFDHTALAKILHGRDCWILSYNDSEEIHKMYARYKFHYPKWKYGMSNNKNSREVLIFSSDIAEAWRR